MRIDSRAGELIGAERVEPEGRKPGDSHLSSAGSLKYMRTRAKRAMGLWNWSIYPYTSITLIVFLLNGL